MILAQKVKSGLHKDSINGLLHFTRLIKCKLGVNMMQSKIKLETVTTVYFMMIM